MKKAILACILVFGFTHAAHSSCIQNGNTLNGLVGLGSGGTLIYTEATSQLNECSCTHFRFKPENTNINIAMSVLLAARMADKKVRIDISEPGNCDTATNVYIQN